MSAADDQIAPLVTFVVPCYNFGRFLGQCLTSILAQTYPHLELLVLDNCSDDDTPEVAQSFRDPRVKYLRNTENIGHIRNFNKGVALAAGKYVWVIAADDWLRSAEVLERYVQVMERHPEIGYVFCRALDSRGERNGTLVTWADSGQNDRIWNGRDFVAGLLESNCIVMSSAMARKECYDRIGMFPHDLPHAADLHQWCHFALHYDVAYFAEPMVVFRTHDESLSSAYLRASDTVCMSEVLVVLQRVREEVNLETARELRRRCDAAIASQHVALGDRQYWRGESVEASKSYWSGIKSQPWRLQAWAKYILALTGRVGAPLRRFVSHSSRN